jgi:hypothetical protein
VHDQPLNLTQDLNRHVATLCSVEAPLRGHFAPRTTLLIPAHWTKWVVHDPSLALKTCDGLDDLLGPTAAPSRQPVIAYFLEKV